jgi:hypothetical protein
VLPPSAVAGTAADPGGAFIPIQLFAASPFLLGLSGKYSISDFIEIWSLAQVWQGAKPKSCT